MGTNFWMTGTPGFHLNNHGKVNSSEMLNVWNETSKEETNDVDSMMKINSHMVVHLNEESEKLMLTQSGKDMTVKIHQLEPNKSQLVSENGLKDISQNVQVKRTSITKSTESTNGILFSKIIF